MQYKFQMCGSPSTAVDIHHCKSTVSFHRSLKWVGAPPSVFPLLSLWPWRGFIMSNAHRNYHEQELRLSIQIQLRSRFVTHLTTFIVSHPDCRVWKYPLFGSADSPWSNHHHPNTFSDVKFLPGLVSLPLLLTLILTLSSSCQSPSAPWMCSDADR